MQVSRLGGQPGLGSGSMGAVGAEAPARSKGFDPGPQPQQERQQQQQQEQPARAPPSKRGRVRQPGGKQSGDDGQRLNKFVAAAGLASRRGADDIIFAGRVKVNGEVVMEPGRQVDQRRDKVAVDGKQLSAAAGLRKYYFALNKPKGFICSNKSEWGEDANGRLVVDLFSVWLKNWKQRNHGAGPPPRLFTVGRLDVQSIGLIFVTNDGDWAHKVMHPSSGLTKEYSVTLNRKPAREELARMAGGCEMSGVLVQPVGVSVDDSDLSKPARIRVVVAEGRNREVRNLVEHAGLEVRTLRRVRVGGYRLPRSVPFGQFQELKPHEVRRILNVGADRTQ